MSSTAEDLKSAPEHIQVEGPEGELLQRSRDRVLEGIWRYVPQKDVSETNQKWLAQAVEYAQWAVICEVTRTVLAHEFQIIDVSVSAPKAGKEDTIEAKITCSFSEDNVLGLFKASRCVLALASPETFRETLKDARVLKDQPDMLEEVDQATENAERLKGISELPDHDPETGEVEEAPPTAPDETEAFLGSREPEAEPEQVYKPGAARGGRRRRS